MRKDDLARIVAAYRRIPSLLSKELSAMYEQAERISKAYREAAQAIGCYCIAEDREARIIGLSLHPRDGLQAKVKFLQSPRTIKRVAVKRINIGSRILPVETKRPTTRPVKLKRPEPVFLTPGGRLVVA